MEIKVVFLNTEDVPNLEVLDKNPALKKILAPHNLAPFLLVLDADIVVDLKSRKFIKTRFGINDSPLTLNELRMNAIYTTENFLDYMENLGLYAITCGMSLDYVAHQYSIESVYEGFLQQTKNEL